MSYFSKKVNNFSEVVGKSVCSTAHSNIISADNGIDEVCSILKSLNKSSSVFVVGNGGSAAVAMHAVIDLRNVVKVSAHSLTEASTITCFGNDYGYEHIYAKALETSVCAGDLLIAISSSGNSQNIINAAQMARSKGARIVTFSGFSAENKLRGHGDINFWCDSSDYGIVEVGHQLILHTITDKFL